MKKIFFIIFFITGSMVANAQEVQQQPVSMDSLFRLKARESIGNKFPSFTAPLGDQYMNNDSIAGKVVFINFWFEACPPCMAELNSLKSLYHKYSSNRNFLFLSFTFDKPADVPRIKKKLGIPYMILPVSRQECYRLNQNNGFPTSMVLSKDGIIKEMITGGDTDQARADKLIRTLIYPAIEAALAE